MISENKPKVINERIVDFDANSLYPSAQARAYYPMGKPIPMTQEMIDYFNVPENLMLITEDE